MDRGRKRDSEDDDTLIVKDNIRYVAEHSKRDKDEVCAPVLRPLPPMSATTVWGCRPPQVEHKREPIITELQDEVMLLEGLPKGVLSGSFVVLAEELVQVPYYVTE